MFLYLLNPNHHDLQMPSLTASERLNPFCKSIVRTNLPSESQRWYNRDCSKTKLQAGLKWDFRTDSQILTGRLGHWPSWWSSRNSDSQPLSPTAGWVQLMSSRFSDQNAGNSESGSTSASALAPGPLAAITMCWACLAIKPYDTQKNIKILKRQHLLIRQAHKGATCHHRKGRTCFAVQCVWLLYSVWLSTSRIILQIH